MRWYQCRNYAQLVSELELRWLKYKFDALLWDNVLEFAGSMRSSVSRKLLRTNPFSLRFFHCLPGRVEIPSR